MEGSVWLIAAVVVAAFGGPTWAWAVLGLIGIGIVAVQVAD